VVERGFGAVGEKRVLGERDGGAQACGREATPARDRGHALFDQHPLGRARLELAEALEHLGIREEEPLDLVADRCEGFVLLRADPHDARAVLVEKPAGDACGLGRVRGGLRARVLDKGLCGRRVRDRWNRRLPCEGRRGAADRRHGHRPCEKRTRRMAKGGADGHLAKRSGIDGRG